MANGQPSYSLKTLLKVLLSVFVCTQVACFSQKDSILNRNLQNLTAQYNILYNANLLLKESEENIQLAYKDTYDRLIPVYQEPNESLSQPEIVKLDEAILKANKVITEKTVSRYVEDAYFVVAKANHLKSNFFSAVGFFDYVYENHNNKGDLKQASLAWKARSLMQLELFDEAKSTLDSAIKYINIKKKSAADVYATRTQLFIHNDSIPQAITTLKKALKFVKNRHDRLRWTFLLAQLQHQAGQRDSAYINYTRIVKSNSNFEMSFNADLNRISIESERDGAKIDRVARLKKLLKDDNNTELIDQIYYHIGMTYEEEGDINNAIKSYQTSVQKSIANQNQKGLSYLKIADLYFHSSNYIKSKAYYDSTLSTLSKTFPGYQKIQKKANNIELLADRLSSIAEENTLQKLAQLPKIEQEPIIDSLLAQKRAIASSQNKNTINLTASETGDTKFYFNNTTTLSQGLANFKKTWGNRALEDDWRRSQKTNSNVNNPTDITSNDLENNSITPSIAKPDNSTSSADSEKLAIIERIPLTSEQCIASDQKIASAYFDIANHYHKVINDPEEAIKTYELLLTLYPNNKYKVATYYNLYRLYDSRDAQKSAYYKNLILDKYPESIFAKTIINPSYSKQTSDQEVALNLFYDETYCTYTEKKYSEVIRYTNLGQNRFGINKLSPQIAYLNALAIGHTNKLEPFETSLKKITTDFPNDSLVVPLVKKHLIFIDAQRKTFASRPVALLENESPEFRIFEEPQMEITPAPQVNTPAVTPTIASQQIEEVVAPVNIVPNQTVEAPTTLTLPSSPSSKKTPRTTTVASPTVESQNDALFSSATSGVYYFVIAVTEPASNLSSSRFGIGQFNRSNFSDIDIKHQVKLLNDQNQLIFVGEFDSKAAVADYHKKISTLMPAIMKISDNSYSYFYISKENFDKLIDKQTITWYIHYFKKNL